MEVLEEMKHWVTMSRNKERERDGLKTSPAAGKRMAHVSPSEKESSYTILNDPARGRVEALQDVSGIRLGSSLRRVVRASSWRWRALMEAMIEANSDV